jgi:diaminopimelate epimerase
MRLKFTKMHGAGNDFIVLDGTRTPIELSDGQFRALADRRLGIGADQVLIVDPAPSPEVDFGYRIHNSSGEEVEHCGNGARCFLRYVHEHGLSTKPALRVQTVNRRLELALTPDGRVRVDMQRPLFEHDALPFEAAGLVPKRLGGFETWPVPLPDGGEVQLAVLSMGNPHAVVRVDDVNAYPVARIGPWLESHVRFPRRVNAGFVQVLARDEARLRVHERGAGETLACGTGACAAVVAGIRLGWFDEAVEVHTRGGDLRIEWPLASAGVQAHVSMTGPATTVFEGEIEL